MTLKEIIRGLADEAAARGPLIRMGEVLEAGKSRVLAHPDLVETLVREAIQKRIKDHMKRRKTNGAA